MSFEALRVHIRRYAVIKPLRRIVHPALMGTLRRTKPLSLAFGSDRGQPVDRYYIEQFLADHRADIRGRVLEVKDSSYTKRFASGQFESDVLDIRSENPRATIIADLQRADSVEGGHFDCFLLTQTIGLIPDVRTALEHAHRLLKPGGVLLLTAPGLGSRAADKTEAPGDYWRFTKDALKQLLWPIFRAENVQLYSYGNVLAAVALLMGMAREELSAKELEVNDLRFPVVIAARAVRNL